MNARTRRIIVFSSGAIALIIAFTLVYYPRISTTSLGEKVPETSTPYITGTFEPWKNEVLGKLSRIAEQGRFSIGDEVLLENKMIGDNPYVQTSYMIKDSGQEIGYIELTEYTGSHIINVYVDSLPGDFDETSRAIAVLEVSAIQLISGWEESENTVSRWALNLVESGRSEDRTTFGDLQIGLNLYDGWGYKLRVESSF